MFLRLLSGESIRKEDYVTLTRAYRLGMEAGKIIREHWVGIPDEVILKGLRNRRNEIREACFDVLVLRINRGDYTFLKRLRNSSGYRFTAAYFRLTMSRNVRKLEDCSCAERELLEFCLLQRICRAHSNAGAQADYRILRDMRPKAASKAFGKSLVDILNGKAGIVLNKIRICSPTVASVHALAAEMITERKDVVELIRLFVALNRLEKGPYGAPANERATVVSNAIRKVASPRVVGVLRSALEEIRLYPSSREVLLAIFENARDESDVTTVSHEDRRGQSCLPEFPSPIWSF
jgi:hypothetical protein